MITIKVPVTKKELQAIREYAHMTGEPLPRLVRKIVIQEITFMKNRGTHDPVFYEYNLLIPENISADEEEKIIEANYNKIRKILGWTTISLRGIS